MPMNFGSTSTASTDLKHLFSVHSLRRLDFLGAGLLLSGSLLLVTALVEVSINFSWSSGVIITLLVLSAVSWIAFFAWEWHISMKQGTQEPIFPWRFFHNRPWIGMLMSVTQQISSNQIVLAFRD